MTQTVKKSQIFLHNTDTNEDVILDNVKVDNDELINENGDIYKILSREYRRSKVRYNVTLKMKNTVGGCACQDQLVQQAYRKFIDSLEQEDQQGFRELLTGQPDIDNDIIDANYTNPEIRQKFKQSGIASTHLDLTDKQKTDLIFGKARRQRNYNVISEDQLKISEKYFNMRPDDLQELRNRSLLTQIKQQNDTTDIEYPTQNNRMNVEQEFEEIDVIEDQPVQQIPQELIGQARKKTGSKKRKFNKLYYSTIDLDNDDSFLTTGVHNFKFRTFRMKQQLNDDEQEQLELFDDLKQLVLSNPIPGETLDGSARKKTSKRHFTQPMNEEPDQGLEESAGIEEAQNKTQEEIPNENQNENQTQNEVQEEEEEVSLIESSTSEDTSDDTSDGTSEGTSDGTSEDTSVEQMPRQQLFKRLKSTTYDDEDSFELI